MKKARKLALKLAAINALGVASARTVVSAKRKGGSSGVVRGRILDAEAARGKVRLTRKHRSSVLKESERLTKKLHGEQLPKVLDEGLKTRKRKKAVKKGLRKAGH